MSSVAERADRVMTRGCLTLLAVLIVVGGTVMSAFWYTLWRTDNITEAHRAAAEDELRSRIDRTAQDSLHALRATSTTDPAVLTGLISKHTEATVITYDTGREEFAAVVESAVTYDTAHLLGRGAERITSCEVFTYSLGPEQAWRVDVSVRQAEACGPGDQIGDLARSARQALEIAGGDLTTVRAVERVLGQAAAAGRVTVRKVTPVDGAVTVSAVLADRDRKVAQCYLFTLPRSGGTALRPVTAGPAISC